MNQIAARTRQIPRHRARAVAIAVAALLSVGVAACGDDGDAAMSGSSTTPAASSGSTASGAGSTGPTGSVSVMNQVKFVNPELRVAVGTAVEFDNQDSQAHTAISDDNSTFDTGLIQAGAKKSVTFSKAGTFAYHCSLHPFMKAQIVVT